MSATSSTDSARLHRRGVLLILAAALLWSAAGFFSRAIPVDLWTMQAGRAMSGGLLLLLIALWQHGRATPRVFAAIGWIGLAVVPLAAAGMVSFIAALKFATVAQVMIVYATQPFVSAAQALVLLGEPMGRRTVIASAAAVAGVAISVAGGPQGGNLIGVALAFLMVFTFGFVMVLARGRHEISMTAVNCLAALLCVAVCWPLAQAAPLGWQTIALLALFGASTLGLGMFLLMAGARHVPSGEASLLALLDVPLSPLWVWLAFGEQAGAASMVGGAIVLGALVWQIAGASGPPQP